MLRDLHVVCGWIVIAGNAAVGCWALAAHRFETARRPSLWWATGAVQVLMFVQAAFGVARLTQLEGAEIDQFHLFYGAGALASVGIIYSYRSQLEAHRYLLYGFGGLFLMGMALRSATLSPLA